MCGQHMLAKQSITADHLRLGFRGCSLRSICVEKLAGDTFKAPAAQPFTTQPHPFPTYSHSPPLPHCSPPFTSTPYYTTQPQHILVPSPSPLSLTPLPTYSHLLPLPLPHSSPLLTSSLHCPHSSLAPPVFGSRIVNAYTAA